MHLVFTRDVTAHLKSISWVILSSMLQLFRRYILRLLLGSLEKEKLVFMDKEHLFAVYYGISWCNSSNLFVYYSYASFLNQMQLFLLKKQYVYRPNIMKRIKVTCPFGPRQYKENC